MIIYLVEKYKGLAFCLRKLAVPEAEGEEGEGDAEELTDGEGAHPEEAAVGKAVGVESDSEEVGAEPGPGGDDVAEDGKRHESAFADEPAPAGVEGDGAHDEAFK